MSPKCYTGNEQLTNSQTNPQVYNLLGIRFAKLWQHMSINYVEIL